MMPKQLFQLDPTDTFDIEREWDRIGRRILKL